MTELAMYQGPQAPARVDQHAANDTVTRIADWAQSATAAYGVAKTLVSTSFVPVAFRNKPEEATAAILSGAEVGLSPMAALKAFDVIQGQAAPRAITLRAIVQSRGHQMTVKESTETRCVMEGRRVGEDQWQRVVWTIDRAQRLGLTGKDQWKKQPQTMLIARATSELARLVASDAILGIPYSVEELQDADDTAEVTPIDKPRRARRKVERVQPESPALPDEDPAPQAVEVDGEQEPITPAQTRKLHTVFSALGYADRDAKLAKAMEVVGRDIASSTELTKVEASVLIDTLETEQVQRTEDPPEDDLWGTTGGAA